jgi:hypothetical protein
MVPLVVPANQSIYNQANKPLPAPKAPRNGHPTVFLPIYCVAMPKSRTVAASNIFAYTPFTAQPGKEWWPTIVCSTFFDDRNITNLQTLEL